MNNNLVPKVPYSGISGGAGGNADRSISFAHTLIGTLKQITYPTKGYSTFTYEQNTWEDNAEAEDVAIIENKNSITATGTQNLTPVCTSSYIDAIDLNYQYELTYTYDAFFQSAPERYDPYVMITGIPSIGNEQVLVTHVINYSSTDPGPVTAVTNLPAGKTYRMEVCAYAGQDAHANSISLKKVNPQNIGQPIARPTAGLRISKIENTDIETGKVNVRTITYGNGGYLVNTMLESSNGIPSYTSVSQYKTEIYSDLTLVEIYTTYTLSVSSSPILGLSPSSVPVAYERVHEWLGTSEDNIGRIETIFRRSYDQVSGMTPQVSRHTARTKVEMENYYDRTGTLVGYTDYEYDEQNLASVIGFRVKRVMAGTQRDYVNDFTVANYTLYSTWYPLKRKSVYTISPNGALEETTTFAYDPTGMHTYPIRQTTINSKGETVQTSFAYPTDVISTKNNCYHTFRTQLASCNTLTDVYVIEAQTCRDIWDACYMPIQQALANNFVESYPNRHHVRQYLVAQFKQCLNDNGYYQCIDNLGQHYQYEHCLKSAFVDYQLCQEEFSNQLIDEFENDLTVDEKSNALLALYHWYSAPLETKVLKGTQELERSNSIYSFSSDNIPLKSSIVLTHAGTEVDPVVAIRKYDSKANPIEILDHKDGLVKSYVWGYNNTSLIAEVVNTEVQHVGYTSFESDSNEGNLTFQISSSVDGRTGYRSHALNGKAVVKSGLTPTIRYKISYWAKSGTPSISAGVVSSFSEQQQIDGWTYHEKMVSNVTSVTITGTGSTLIDELRIAPENARISTFTHKPGIGIVSATDDNNNTTFYQYDSQGRLISVEDHYHKLLRVLQYNYRDE